jgi:heme exporter protein CcmD
VNPWPFVIAAYALTLLASAGLLVWSWIVMRRAEAEAARLGRDREA